MSENEMQDNDKQAENLGESALNDLLCTIPRYDFFLGLSESICEEQDWRGDWVKFEDLEAAINKIKNGE